MKKIAIITSAALLLTAAVSAQTDTVPKQNTEPVPQQPASTEQPVAKVYNDKYNNWSADTYKMQPMPEALTIEKIFPVIGKYEVTNKEGAATTLTVTIDETNKGIVWIEGLPQGKIKATLRKSPATYKIPVQPLEAQMTTEEPVADVKDTKAKSAKSAKAEKAKELPEGVLIYDKDANVVNLCLGCKYNNDDPAMVFTPASEQEATEEPAEQKKTTKTAKKTTVKKVEKTKPVHYSGSKVIEDVPATTEEPVQQQQQPQQQQ